MTPQEAIDIIRVGVSEVEWNYPMDYAAALNMAIDALEKQDAVKPISPPDSSMHFCGKCRYPVGKHNNYCPQCGKAVKWDASDWLGLS